MTSTKEKWQEKVLEDGIWTVKKAQFSRGHDGPNGYMTCDLYLNGKLALHVIDDSMGGCFMYQGSPKIKGDWRQNEKDFYAYCKTLPNQDPDDLWPEGYDVGPDGVVDYLAMREAESRSIKRKMKRNVFGLEDGKLYSWKFKCNVEAKHYEYMKEKYPKVEILTDLETILDHHMS
jgi:hypothetical protein